MEKENTTMSITISKSNSQISVKADGITNQHQAIFLEEVLSSLKTMILEESTAASISSASDSDDIDWEDLELEELV